MRIRPRGSGKWTAVTLAKRTLQYVWLVPSPATDELVVEESRFEAFDGVDTFELWSEPAPDEPYRFRIQPSSRLEKTLKPVVVTMGKVAIVSTVRVPRFPRDLTDAEAEVLDHLMAGHSDRAIAQLRDTSRHTVANQTASILRKMGVGSRYEAAAKLLRECQFCAAGSCEDCED